MRRRTGFTLLEVMVALAIAVPALLIMFRQGATALDATGASLAYQEAISRAQSRLAALTQASLAPGDREGDDGGAYRWHTRIVALGTSPAPRKPASDTARRSAYAAGVTLYGVSVQIAWAAGAGSRSVTLETRLVGPAAADGP